MRKQKLNVILLAKKILIYGNWWIWEQHGGPGQVSMMCYINALILPPQVNLVSTKYVEIVVTFTFT